MTDIFIASLATYGISVLLVEYDGPFNILYKLRSFVGAFNCFACTSVWICAAISYFTGIGFIEYIGALGLALLLDRIAS